MGKNKLLCHRCTFERYNYNGKQQSDYYKVKIGLLRENRRGYHWGGDIEGLLGLEKLQGYSLYNHSSNYIFFFLRFSESVFFNFIIKLFKNVYLPFNTFYFQSTFINTKYLYFQILWHCSKQPLKVFAISTFQIRRLWLRNLQQIAHSCRVIRAEPGFKFRQLADSNTIPLMPVLYWFSVTQEIFIAYKY